MYVRPIRQNDMRQGVQKPHELHFMVVYYNIGLRQTKPA